ncbi:MULTISPECIES: hypothetical protein [unclassified Photobacterium]|uniref:hypothetical protein n=1 Tax=unclassified Photobacterium TaxID=2628852 RepID=UPI000D16BA6F|nr:MULTISPECIES: hypothetical protein [unclassified Photobacterium]PSV41031.1 hypothetical protein C9J38_03060 [Photobacterium sp. GB-210]PSV50190.1 hypothetical protein C9J45_21210 [Photobacterium sp. GB-1]
MKKVKLLLIGAIISVITGCAAGVNFKKMSEEQLVVGSTTKAEVVASMGKANINGTNTFNGQTLDIMTYSYAKVGGDAVLPGVTPARAQGLLFNGEVLAGKEYTSSFALDNTKFDLDTAKTIKEGQNRENVVSVMGEPKGKYLYPIIEDQTGYALVYMFSQTKGFKTRTDLLVVEFNSENVVTKTKLSSSGNL